MIEKVFLDSFFKGIVINQGIKVLDDLNAITNYLIIQGRFQIIKARYYNSQ